MNQVAISFRVLILSLLPTAQTQVYSFMHLGPAFSLNSASQTLPGWVVKDMVIDQLSWQGLPMKIEFITIPKKIDIFFQEISSIIPEGTQIIKNGNIYQLSWFAEDRSYVLLLEEHGSLESAAAKGIFSTMVVSRSSLDHSVPRSCQADWLPEDAKLIFSMGDEVGGVNQARIDGYLSSVSFDEVRAIIFSRLNQLGWIRLAESSQYLQSGYSTTIEAICGKKHARIQLQRKTYQTRISIMRIEQ